jgi:hypothetical protein
MLLYNLVYSISGRQRVALLYAVSLEDAKSQVQALHPGVEVVVLVLIPLRWGTS